LKVEISISIGMSPTEGPPLMNRAGSIGTNF
jgi:hypothetical protein